MMITCAEHGLRFCVPVTEDLLKAILADRQAVPMVAVLMKEEESEWPCYVTVHFAEEHGLAQHQVVDYFVCEWWTSILGYCEKCFFELHKNKYDLGWQC